MKILFKYISLSLILVYFPNFCLESSEVVSPSFELSEKYKSSTAVLKASTEGRKKSQSSIKKFFRNHYGKVIAATVIFTGFGIVVVNYNRKIRGLKIALATAQHDINVLQGESTENRRLINFITNNIRNLNTQISDRRLNSIESLIEDVRNELGNFSTSLNNRSSDFNARISDIEGRMQTLLQEVKRTDMFDLDLTPPY